MSRGPGRRWVRVGVLLAGWVLPAALLYGRGLAGSKLLLPLYVLNIPRVYVARPPPLGAGEDPILMDPVEQFEPFRRFAAAEVRAGRLPLWNPYCYCGSPFLANNQAAVFSPFRLLDYAWPAPEALAWGQLLRTVVFGAGAYLFFRIAVGVGFWPAAAGAWCWPLSGFMTLWALFPLAWTAGWLPWVLLGVRACVSRPAGLGAVGLALGTAAMLLSGHAATAEQCMLGAGAYAAWLLARRGGGIRGKGRGLLAVCAGVVGGVLLSAPQTFPTIEYLRSSLRLAGRVARAPEGGVQGAGAVLQVVLPYVYGSSEVGSLYWGWGNRLESAAAGYGGVLGALALVPLGVLAGRRRREAAFWVAVAVFGLLPALGVPGLARVFEAPPFSYLRNNRLVVLTCFAVVTGAVLGLEAVIGGARPGGRWGWSFAALPVALAVWCAYRCGHFPAALEARLGAPGDWEAVRRWFVGMYAGYAVLCALAAVAWAAVWAARGRWGSAAGVRRLAVVLGVVYALELAWSARQLFPLSEAGMYYPAVGALAELAKPGAGRSVGVQCLPPNLNMPLGLWDVRGYDAADPSRIVELLMLARNPAFPPPMEYAATQWLVPRRLSPLVNLLNVRFFYGIGAAPPGAVAAGGYWVAPNPRALPRAFVPRRVEVVNDGAERLRRVGAEDFDPGEVALVEAEGATAVSLRAASGGAAVGRAEVVGETPTRVRVRVEMATAGVLVLADSWDGGWGAVAGGREVPVLRADHALRAVPLGAGSYEVEFRYWPRSLTAGLIAAGLAGLGMVTWVVVVVRGEGRGRDVDRTRTA